MYMEVVVIINLVTTVIVGLTQAIQMYIDYKRDKINNHDSLYEVKAYNSNCCNITLEK